MVLNVFNLILIPQSSGLEFGLRRFLTKLIFGRYQKKVVALHEVCLPNRSEGAKDINIRCFASLNMTFLPLLTAIFLNSRLPVQSLFVHYLPTTGK